MAEIQLDGNVIERKITRADDIQEGNVELKMAAKDGSTINIMVVERLTDVTPKGKRKKVMAFVPQQAAVEFCIKLINGDYRHVGIYHAVKVHPGHRDFAYDIGEMRDGKFIEHLQVSTSYDCDNHDKSPTKYTFRAYIK